MSVLALAPSSPDDVAREVTQMQAKLSAYWDAVNLITLNAHSITKQVLIKVDEHAPPPAWWDTLSINFTNCQKHAQLWIDTIYPSLTRIPQAIIDYNTYFEATSKRILNLLAQMGTRKPTEAEKKSLIIMLNLLLTKLKNCRHDIELVRADIKSFTTDMAADHRALTVGANSIMTAIEDNNKSIALLKAQIEGLKVEIEQLNVQLIAALHGIAASVVVGYMLMTVTPYLAFAIAVIGVSVSLGFMIDALVRIGKKQQEIIDQSATLKRSEAQGVALAVIASTVDSMNKSIDAITTAIDTVSSAWATLEAKMTSVITALTAASVEHVHDILLQEIDVEVAQKAWAQLKTYAEQLQEIKLKDSGQVTPIKAFA